MNATDVLIVIPARGGSQRLSRKALRVVGGRPLLWYTLDYVSKLGLANQSVVVTDDTSFADYVKQFGQGIGVVMEPPVVQENSLGAVSVAVQHETNARRRFERVAMCHPTVPVRPPRLLEQCMKLLTPDADGVVAVKPAATHPDLTLSVGENGEVTYHGSLPLSQDVSAVYQHSGAMFVFWRRVLEVPSKSMSDFWVGKSIRAVIHPGFPHVDIDVEEDLVWFEFLLERGFTPWAPTTRRSHQNADE